MAGVAPLQEKPRQFVGRIFYLLRKLVFKLVYILQFRCSAENGINIEFLFAEFFKLTHLVFTNIKNIDAQKRITIHFVGIIQIGKEAIDETVC